ncbi:MAG TPA: hypothetical protein VL117_09400 [Thermoleophilia bacterium]|nr:hypothetical protein [Thermoleophilia bacterium]
MWRTRTAALIAACLVFVAVLVVVAAACGSSTPPAPTPTSSATSAPASPSPPASPSAPATPAQPTGSAAPTGFRAASVTFVSSDQAFVLGTAPGAGTVLLRSLDRGQSWVRLAAPNVTLGRPGSSGPHVWGVRFASPGHGFIFGKGLWETTDGGAHWALDATPAGSILSLATIDGQVLALASTNPGGAPATLLRRPLAGGSWTAVATVKSPDLLDSNDLISTQAGTAAVLDGTSVLVTTNGGLTVHHRATPSALQPATPSSVAVTSSGSLALLIAGPGAAGSVEKVVFTSADLGAHWTKAGTPSREGDPGTLAGGSPSSLLLTAASGASWVFRSASGGHAWATALTYGDGGLGWADLGFTTPTNAVVIHGPADKSGNGDGRPGQLLLSSNGGATWQVVSF